MAEIEHRIHLTDGLLKWLKDPQANLDDEAMSLTSLEVPIHDGAGNVVARGSFVPNIDPETREASFTLKVSW